MSNAAEDKFYFRRATDSEIENLLLEAESLMDDGFVSKAIPYLRKASNSIDTNTSPRLKKILSDMMREANVRFSRPGAKAKMARNSEYDTDGVKNLIHKETRDAEWGIDLYMGARGGNQYHAYHAFIGESVTTRVFGSRSEAEAWLNKKNAAGHPNKRKNSLSGDKVKFAWTPSAARERNYVLDVARKFDMDCAEKIATLKKALASVRDLRAIIAKTENIDELESTRDKMYSIMRDAKMNFSRSGGKAKFAWQPEIQKKLRLLDANVDASQVRLREALKTGRWSHAASICRNIGSMYSGPNGLASYYDELQTAADKEWKSKNARSGGKAKFENPMDIEMLWKRQSNGDWAAVLWDVNAKRMVRTVRTFKSEREAKDFVNAWWQKNRPIG